MVETELEHVVGQNFDVPMPLILEEIVEFEEVVDTPVLQLEFIFLVYSCCFFAVAWSVADLPFKNSSSLRRPSEGVW